MISNAVIFFTNRITVFIVYGIFSCLVYAFMGVPMGKNARTIAIPPPFTADESDCITALALTAYADALSDQHPDFTSGPHYCLSAYCSGGGSSGGVSVVAPKTAPSVVVIVARVAFIIDTSFLVLLLVIENCCSLCATLTGSWGFGETFSKNMRPL